VDRGMVDFLLDQLDDPAVSARAMFGGHGIYRGGQMFGIVYDDAVYMKVSEEEARTSERPPFQPNAKQTLRSYREVLADELEDRDALQEFAARAQRAAES
jgi:DNA transformation protein and related proteins